VKDQAQSSPGHAAVTAGTDVAGMAAPGAVATAGGTAKEAHKAEFEAENMPDYLKVTGKDRAVGEAAGVAGSTAAGGKVIEGVGAEKAIEHKESMAEYDVADAQKSAKKAGDAAKDVEDKGKGGDGES
jgi:hypothetical protein